MRRRTAVLAVLLAAVGLLPAVGAASADPVVTVRAGVGVADATWHVGSCSGQYCDARDPSSDPLSGPTDPHAHNRIKEASYGVQSRLTMRALVVEGSNGRRVALVKSDLYLAQDLLLRRVGQLLAGGDSGIGYGDILHAATHNHSSPYYATPAIGVWVFQDVVDLRQYEYLARSMAAAIEEAAADLRPARMGATVLDEAVFKGNITGPQTADDGSPAGYPRDFGDRGVTVLRFDDLTDPARPAPLATWMNFGQHPEGLDGYNLVTADYVGHLERMVEAGTGAPLVFSQGDVGSAEGPYYRDGYETLPTGEVRAWAHVGHAQVERGARWLADTVVAAWGAIGASDAAVPFSSDFPVDLRNAWVPGPLSHPYPSVSNCRSEPTLDGEPGLPVAGFPDCERPGAAPEPLGSAFAMVADNLAAHGLPVPSHYDAPGFGAVEENARLRLQAVRLGDVLLASCACEAQVDLILNLETRTDRVQDNQWLGYDWSASCTANADGTWACRGLTVSDDAYQRMRAQVFNDAAGWDAPANAVAAGSEPEDPAAILGNFTHSELPPDLGYGLSVGVGHAGDYNGYTVSYREYMAYDHYRKALTTYGPHTADYMVTRLVAMAGAMRGGAELAPEVHDGMAQADEARQLALATALGAASGTAWDAWQAALPDDAGPVAALAQPEAITRFDAATFSWRGGSNAVDNPVVGVERLVDGAWVGHGGQEGDVVTTLTLPEGVAGVAGAHAGTHEWVWAASFEAYTSDQLERLGQTPVGTYRFVVDGAARTARSTVPYTLTSEPFEVRPWGGIAVAASGVTVEGDVVVGVAPVTYPRTYESPVAYLADDGDPVLCRTCSFRPWARSAAVSAVDVTVTRASGTVEVVPATLTAGGAAGEPGTWTAPVALGAGDTAEVLPGAVRDANGETNAATYSITP